jgi:hypothetical protein
MLIAQSLPPFGPLPEKGKKSTPRFQSNVQYCALSSPFYHPLVEFSFI